MNNTKIDLFILGSTSELMQALFVENMEWFKANVNRLIVTQRSADCPEVYKQLPVISVALDCSDTQQFGQKLKRLVDDFATHDRPMHVWPSFGKFNWNYAAKNPVFTFADDVYQVNLISRLQVLDAFKPFVRNTRFHFFGSLFANFPYTGDYALSMWYINQLTRNAQYADYQLGVYNIGGCKTGFWNHASMGGSHPFLHQQLPTRFLFESAFVDFKPGVKTFYPSLPSRFACWMGRRGVRVL